MPRRCSRDAHQTEELRRGRFHRLSRCFYGLSRRAAAQDLEGQAWHSQMHGNQDEGFSSGDHLAVGLSIWLSGSFKRQKRAGRWLGRPVDRPANATSERLPPQCCKATAQCTTRRRLILVEPNHRGAIICPEIRGSVFQPPKYSACCRRGQTVELA